MHHCPTCRCWVDGRLASLVDFIGKHPGLRTPEIKRRWGTDRSSRALQIMLARLVEQGDVRCVQIGTWELGRGIKRYYFPRADAPRTSGG
jgi:hypothetical protein